MSKVPLIRVVTDFYRQVIGAPQLAHYFEGVSMETLIRHQTAFISAIGSDIEIYTASHLRRIHEPLDISPGDYDLLIGLLEATLVKHDLPQDQQRSVLEQFQSYRSAILHDS